MNKKSVFFLILLLFIFLSLIFLQRNRTQVQSSMVSAEGKLVEGEPDFPIPPDAKIEKSYSKLEAGKKGYEAVYKVNTPIEKTMAWYHDELLKQGWTIIDESIEYVTTDLYIKARRGDELINVFGETENGKTELSIEYPVQ